MTLPSNLRPIPIITDLVASDAPPQSVALYCPACEGLEQSAFDSLVLLPIHDANGRLLSGLGSNVSWPSEMFAGVLALDPFRRHADIFQALDNAGCHGVVNFPSVTAIDGEMRVNLEDFGHGAKSELALLRAAVAEGFSALAVVDSFGMGQEAIAIGVHGLVAARHANEAMIAELAELARETKLGLFRLPDDIAHN
ncbi:phosphoenolpyruvate hydrolase family protein [Ensifer sp. LCM 4579]|uniref:phosphoenolpyruvate hydrolase family protein n=1 Tax=Ensifer sp. LCM 4579 TaxID=1848292 RepID=UPI0008D9EE71|nr:phosphoenolpyruvate hydrolase family protein [Ensifer sp. LCM 4579]OHV78892.1 hypothetical protein LCM4579_24670 [Ensifer sp. LCM 4579]